MRKKNEWINVHVHGSYRLTLTCINWSDNETKCLLSLKDAWAAFTQSSFCVSSVWTGSNFHRSTVELNDSVCLSSVLSAPISDRICVHVWKCVLFWDTEWAACVPSPPAEAELVTVYWLGKIHSLQGACSRWSKLAEWLWQTCSVHCCCKVNNDIKPSHSEARFQFFFCFVVFLLLALRLVIWSESLTVRAVEQVCINAFVWLHSLIFPARFWLYECFGPYVDILTFCFVYSPKSVFTGKCALFHTSPTTSFTLTAAEIAGAADKFPPNNYLKYRVTCSGARIKRVNWIPIRIVFNYSQRNGIFTLCPPFKKFYVV